MPSQQMEEVIQKFEVTDCNGFRYDLERAKDRS